MREVPPLLGAEGRSEFPGAVVPGAPGAPRHAGTRAGVGTIVTPTAPNRGVTAGAGALKRTGVIIWELESINPLRTNFFFVVLPKKKFRRFTLYLSSTLPKIGSFCLPTHRCY